MDVKRFPLLPFRERASSWGAYQTVRGTLALQLSYYRCPSPAELQNLGRAVWISDAATCAVAFQFSKVKGGDDLMEELHFILFKRKGKVRALSQTWLCGATPDLLVQATL